MDEHRLSQLFRDATGDAPPASFDRDDVVSASRRATARRRSAVAGGSLLGVAALTGGVLLAGPLLGPPSAQPPSASSAESDAADRASEPEVMTPFRAPAGEDPVPAPTTTCGPADVELAADLAAVVDESGRAVAFPGACPVGSRAAGVPVAGGTVYVLLGPAPAGAEQDPPGYGSAPVGDEVLSVLSVPADPAAEPPLAADVDGLARELAARR